jgi:DNA processing protein
MDTILPWLRLQLIPGLGRIGLYKLISRFGSPTAAIAAAPGGWRDVSGLRPGLAALLPAADDPRLAPLLDTLEARGAWLLTILDADYPPLLRAIPDPPVLLFGRGRRPGGEALAIVGSRRPSETGRRAATTFAGEIAARGITIVSGLARGVDTAAHRGALDAGGTTIAVLGCGIDRVYPPENDKLFARIAAEGTLLSEYLPGSEPLPGHFPGRNRIISGLSRGTLIVEAALDSGSLITAELALEQGREVLAVPGSIDRPTSAGPNRLIKDGASPVTESADILAALWPQTPRREMAATDPFAATLEEPARAVWLALGGEPRHIDELAGELGLTAGELSATLLHLELQGGVEQLPGARYLRSCCPTAAP